MIMPKSPARSSHDVVRQNRSRRGRTALIVFELDSIDPPVLGGLLGGQLDVDTTEI